MNITVIGRGRVGGGLADRWERAGHTVTRLGREGGDAVDADAVLVAVPSGQIAAALDRVSGLEGRPRSTRPTPSMAATTPTSRSPTR
jgi:predicted dinucleotide-binding enzyme